MHVTFRQLRLFLALADTGSVSAAARAMHVTQPTASMRWANDAHSSTIARAVRASSRPACVRCTRRATTS